MKWEHKCSYEWLIARQFFLNASEIKQLIPYTATGRDKKITDIDYAKILIKKKKILTKDDCMSYGAAARGHILEPYAINAVNDHLHLNMNHWDDCLIYDITRKVAYSPDGLDIPQLDKNKIRLSTDDIKPTKLVEIKSYSEENHIKCILSEPDKLEERWQIATAMLVSPSIENAIIAFYNPSLLNCELGIIEYDRGDLITEIGIIEKVINDWTKFSMSKLHNWITSGYHGKIKEQDIYEEYEARKRLNPIGG